MKLNGEKLKIDLFVAVALIAFAIFGVATIALKPYFNNLDASSAKPVDQNQYFLNKSYTENDPLITKNPGLKEMLAGPIISDNDPAQGDKFSPVNIVYFSDFECAFCHNQEQVLKKIVQDFPNQVRLIWKDYPNTDQASWSYQAAVSARCAQAQGKFWPYHDLLFELKGDDNQDKLDKAAGMAKLDPVSFKLCLEKSGPKASVNDNIEEANALGINGVPFIYVNDKGLMGEVSYEELKAVVESELGKVMK